MTAAGGKYAAELGTLRNLADEANAAQEASEDAQARFLRRLNADYEAGRISRAAVFDAYFAYREAVDAQPGFALRWDMFVSVPYRDIQRATRLGLGRPNNPDGTWSGPFPLPFAAPAPVTGVSVVYSLIDADGAVCYIGSSHALRARLKRHERDGKQFTAWRAIPCADRKAAYALEDKMIAGQAPYLNRLGVVR